MLTCMWNLKTEKLKLIHIENILVVARGGLILQDECVMSDTDHVAWADDSHLSTDTCNAWFWLSVDSKHT